MGSGAILAGVTDPWTPPDASGARAEREYTALFRIQQRHADSLARRDRGRHPAMIGPGEAVRLLVGLAAGSAVVEDGEEAVDAADLTAALTLMPIVRAEIDQLEASLLMIARGQGMTWQELAFGLGLGSAQAARQRYERLNLRTAPENVPASPPDDVLRRRLLTAGTGGRRTCGSATIPPSAPLSALLTTGLPGQLTSRATRPRPALPRDPSPPRPAPQTGNMPIWAATLSE
jgi:hypothetical protein